MASSSTSRINLLFSGADTKSSSTTNRFDGIVAAKSRQYNTLYTGKTMEKFRSLTAIFGRCCLAHTAYTHEIEQNRKLPNDFRALFKFAYCFWLCIEWVCVWMNLRTKAWKLSHKISDLVMKHSAKTKSTPSNCVDAMEKVVWKIWRK